MRRYAQRNGWKVNLLSCAVAESGGYKEVIAQVSCSLCSVEPGRFCVFAIRGVLGNVGRLWLWGCMGGSWKLPPFDDVTHQRALIHSRGAPEVALTCRRHPTFDYFALSLLLFPASIAS